MTLTVDDPAESAPTPDTPMPTPPPARQRRWRGRLGIQSKLLLMLLATSVVASVVVGVVGYRSGRDALRESAFKQLEEVRASRSREISRQYQRLLDSMAIYTRGTNVQDALDAFTDGFRELGSQELTTSQAVALQTYYDDVFVAGLNGNLGTNSDTAGFLPTSNSERYLQAEYTAPNDDFDVALTVDDAGDGSAWSRAHSRYHDYFRELVNRFGYEDVMLIDSLGDVVYTAYKGVDLGTNLRTGPFRNTALAGAFEDAVASNDPDFIETVDFERYQPSYGVPTGWAVSPIARDGQITGVMAVQINVDAINRIMTGNEQWVADGLGDTGETYIVGPDFLMRSTARRVLEDPDDYERRAVAAGTPPDVAARAARVGGTILIQPVHTQAVERALQGESGEIIERGYLGDETLSAYAPLEFGDLQWVIVAKVQSSEAFQPVTDFTRQLVLWTVAIIVGVALASLLLSQVFVRPVKRLMTGVRRVAAGDLGAQVDATSRDEFGDLGVAFNNMSRSLRTKQELLEEQQRDNERLLLSLMPERVATRYRAGEETIAEDHQDVSVVFADLVNFEDYSAGLTSDESLATLNSLVRSFDEAAGRVGVDRVRTLRHGYLASCGLVSTRLDSVRRVVDFTLEMYEIVTRFNATTGADLTLRAGIDTGTVTSGLVGPNSLAFDMWGDAVNLAYQLQGSRPEPGIFVTGRVYDRVRDSETFVEAAETQTKTGLQQVWQLQVPSR